MAVGMTATDTVETVEERVCARCGREENLDREKGHIVPLFRVRRHRRPPELECHNCWGTEFHKDAPPLEEPRIPEPTPLTVYPKTIDLSDGGRCVLCGTDDGDLTVARFQGLLTHPDGRPLYPGGPLHVRGPRCEDCRSGLDRYGDPYILAGIRRGAPAEGDKLLGASTDLWAVAALEGADDPPGAWQF
jgi:hypothetical protein